MIWDFIYPAHSGGAVKRRFSRLCCFANCNFRKCSEHRPRFPVFLNRRRISCRRDDFWRFLRCCRFIGKRDSRFDSTLRQSLIQRDPFIPCRFALGFAVGLRQFPRCQCDGFFASRTRNGLPHTLRRVFNGLLAMRTRAFLILTHCCAGYCIWLRHS